MIARRSLLKAMAGMPLLCACASTVTRSPSRSGTLRITLSGQALMEHSLCADPYPGFAELVNELHSGDIVFTDLDVAIQTPTSGRPTRDNEFLHVATPDVLSCLDSMGFNTLALANNHAWDLGTEGVLATRSAIREAGFKTVGTGDNIEDANLPLIINRNGLKVAIIAFATGKIRQGAEATGLRAGVNELRLDAKGLPITSDAERIQMTISDTATAADQVIVCHHNDDVGDDMTVSRPWVKDWARECVDAGASIYVSYGAPLLQGIELYKDGLIFFDLGSLVFQTKMAVGYYPAEVWESAIVHCDYGAEGLLSVEIVPVILNEIGDDPARPFATRGRPRIAVGDDATRILKRLAALSAGGGVKFGISNAQAHIIL